MMKSDLLRYMQGPVISWFAFCCNQDSTVSLRQILIWKRRVSGRQLLYTVRLRALCLECMEQRYYYNLEGDPETVAETLQNDWKIGRCN